MKLKAPAAGGLGDRGKVVVFQLNNWIQLQLVSLAESGKQMEKEAAETCWLTHWSYQFKSFDRSVTDIR